MSKTNKYPSLSGKRVAVSGSTGGIGRALCAHLARLGADIVCLDRNAKKAADLADALKAAHPHIDIRYIPMDLEDMASVGAAADRLCEMGTDFLVLCAGAYHIPRKRCENGIDNIFQINFLAPYYLAARMKSHIEAMCGRVVAVGSISQMIARFDPAAPCRLKGGHVTAYGNAKRCLSFALSRLFEDSHSLAVTHPGISPTGITSGYPAFIKAVIKIPMRLIFMPPEKASECVLCGLFTPTEAGQWIGPRVFGIWGKPRAAAMSGYSSREADEVTKEAKKMLKMSVGY